MQNESPNSERETDCAAHVTDAYARLRELFAAAADLEETARADWIEAHVVDAGERAALERLLRMDRASGYFDVPPDEHAARMAEEARPVEGLIGQSIGAFRLVRLVGKGGMAAVFLGEREGVDFAQRVAVKLLHRGLYSEVEQRLFRRERQLLAALEHPHIARLIDGGVTAAGIPYLVVEFVDGVPVTQFASERQLDVRARLRLFVTICRAVAAAHRALIVHRDIKPSNILVSADGVVKLLDFGIAKLLGDDTENATVGVFTPEYAAPEQLANAPATTATDVYALGVLLHELLLGIRPRAQPSRRPSSRIDSAAVASAGLPDPATLPHVVRGDLDTILLKCLAAEPALRYASAGALADDVARHLAGRPVEAHPPSHWYRARKFVQRHRLGVALGSVLAAVLIVALAATLWQARIARFEAARANRIRDFVEDIFAPIDNSVIEAKQTSVHDLLANATAKLEKNSEVDVDERIDLELLFSRLHEKMGESEQAESLARQAAELAETKLAPDDPAALDAEISYAYALLEHNERTPAGALFKAIESRIGGRRLLDGMPLVRLYDGLADVADADGDHEVALDYERRALAERVARFGAESAKAATGYNNIGLSLNLSGRHEAAFEALRHAYAIHMAREGPDSFESAIARNNLAFAELDAGRLRAARDDFLAVEPLYEAPPNNKRSRNARYWQDRCQLAIAIGEGAAESTCAHALSATREIVKSGNASLLARALRIDAQAKLAFGELEGLQQDLAEADTLLASNGDPVALGIDAVSRAEFDMARGRPDAAAVAFADGAARIGHAFPEYQYANALAGRALACARMASADKATCPADALDAARTALDAGENPSSPWLLMAQTAVARVDLDAGRADAASARLRRAITNAEPEVEPTQIRWLAARLWLVVAERRSGHCEQGAADWSALPVALRDRHLEQHPLLISAFEELRAASTCGPLGG